MMKIENLTIIKEIKHVFVYIHDSGINFTPLLVVGHDDKIQVRGKIHSVL